tara:strand:+ start:160 stop:855 length:696 start_codon:yes stop_codon:yes gene_type:complete
MGKSVTFNVDKLIKKLDLIEKVHVPKAAEQALKSFGFDVRELLQKEMREQYQSPSSWTLRSPFFRQEGMTLRVGISDKANSGLSAAQYLAPTDASHGRGRRPVAPTSLDGAMLRRYGITDIAVPVKSSRAGRRFLNSKGALRSRSVQNLLDQLGNPEQSKEQYFVIRPGDSSSLKPGVFRRYRIKGSISQAFVFAKQQQTAKLDFHGVILEAAKERLPKLIQSKLSRLLAQ